MGTCCMHNNSRGGGGSLMEGIYNQSGRDSGATADQKGSDKDSYKSHNGSYSPPQSGPSGSTRTAIRRLSLSSCPAQVTHAKLVFPAAKYGEMRKLGHVVKNWKQRFFVLEGAKLQYYGLGRTNPDAAKFKGELDLEGATLMDDDEAKRITIRAHDTEMVLEFDHSKVQAEWKAALRECIRTANCNSLIKGQRFSAVVDWYNEQYALYAAAANVLRAGHMFCLHHVDVRDGYVELIPVWLQEARSGLGLVFRCDHVTVQTTAAPTASGADPLTEPGSTRSKLEGFEVPYGNINSIMTGSKTEVYHTPEMGGANSTFFSFGTTTETFILEVKSRATRDHWATCIRDVINFIHIPVPGERAEEQRPPKKSSLSRTNSRHSQGGFDSD